MKSGRNYRELKHKEALQENLKDASNIDDNREEFANRISHLNQTEILFQTFIRRKRLGVQPETEKTAYLIVGQFGIGKTVIVANHFFGDRYKHPAFNYQYFRGHNGGVIWLAQTHQANETPYKIARHNTHRLDKLDETTCINFSEVKKCLNLGLSYSQLVCENCQLRPSPEPICDYLTGFEGSARSLHLIAVQHYHKLPNFYKKHGNPKRDWVVFDENPLNYLIETKQLKYGDLVNYRSVLKELLAEIEDDLRKVIVAHRKLCDAILERLDPEIYQDGYFEIPKDIEYPSNALLSQMASHITQANQNGVAIANLAYSIHELFTGLGYCPILYNDAGKTTRAPNKRELTYFKRNPLPEEFQIAFLDATPNVDLLEQATGYKIVKVIEPTPVEYKAQIFQLVDRSWSKKAIESDCQKEQLLKEIVEVIRTKHPNLKTAIISHKDSLRLMKKTRIVTDGDKTQSYS